MGSKSVINSLMLVTFFHFRLSCCFLSSSRYSIRSRRLPEPCSSIPPPHHHHQQQPASISIIVCNSSSSASSSPSNSDINRMPRGVKKENLPSKVCVTCGRPFTWRKKWERVWDEVTTCSKSCNRKRKLNKGSTVGVDNVMQPTPAATGGDGGTELDSLAADFLGINVNVDKESLEFENEVDGGDDDEQSKTSQTSSLALSNNSNILFDEQQSTLLAELILPPTRTPIDNEEEVVLDAKAQRKADKKRKKAQRRAQREGRGDPTAGQKQCTICDKSVNLLIRCIYDESGEWGMVCGKCWNDVSGGVVDGDNAHPYYRYGGLWKNRRAQT